MAFQRTRPTNNFRSNGRIIWCYPEGDTTVYLASGTGKSHKREMAAVGSLPMFRVMQTNTLPRTHDEIRSYAQLQRQIHDALRVQHPEWVEPNGDCPTCESYESRFAELLDLFQSNGGKSAA